MNSLTPESLLNAAMTQVNERDEMQQTTGSLLI